MEFKNLPNGNKEITIESREDAVIAAYAVSQTRSRATRFELIDRISTNKRRLVQKLGAGAAEMLRDGVVNNEKKINLGEKESALVFSALQTFSQLSEHELKHPESIVFVESAAKLLEDASIQDERAQ